jgi:Protein of unknown function (DUF1580)
MLENETVLGLADAARRLPKFRGRRPHTSTLWRWGRRGVMGIKLEVGRLGRRLITSVEALDRFSAALAAVEPAGARPAHVARSTAAPKRERQIRAAERELDEAGI